MCTQQQYPITLVYYQLPGGFRDPLGGLRVEASVRVHGVPIRVFWVLEETGHGVVAVTAVCYSWYQQGHGITRASGVAKPMVLFRGSGAA